MTKRWAMAMAAGLALCLALGVLAIALMSGGASVANGTERRSLVGREVSTLTIHRTVPTNGAGTARTIQGSGSSAGSASMSSSYWNGGFEHHGDD